MKPIKPARKRATSKPTATLGEDVKTGTSRPQSPLSTATPEKAVDPREMGSREPQNQTKRSASISLSNERPRSEPKGKASPASGGRPLAAELETLTHPPHQYAPFAAFVAIHEFVVALGANYPPARIASDHAIALGEFIANASSAGLFKLESASAIIDWVLSDPKLAPLTQRMFLELRQRARLAQRANRPVVPQPRRFGDIDATAEAGQRYSGIREDLRGLASKHPEEVVKAIETLGSKVLVAILEPAADPDGKKPGIRNGWDGRILVDSMVNENVGALLCGGGSVQIPGDLLALLMTLPNAAFANTCSALVDDWGGLAGIQTWLALQGAGVPESKLAPLFQGALAEVRSRTTVSRMCISGEMKTAKFIDYTPMFARAICFGHGGRSLFRSSKPRIIVPLDRRVSESSILSLESVSDLVGVPDPDPLRFAANGRTLRYERADGSVVAIKCMKERESPSKLQHEHDSFALMSAEGKGYPAKARKFEAREKAFSLARFPLENLPANVWKAFELELARGGLNLDLAEGNLTFMSYEVSGLQDPGSYFRYLEEAEDDAVFVTGFENAMRTLGQMAAKGYFNPSLITNSYHQPEADRAWVWSPTLLVPTHDNAGREDQPLSNAKWSNFREGGLADPDEFRHISQLDTAELSKVLGDSHIAKQVMAGGSEEQRLRLVATYLIGRMVHEATVIATRRMVLKGAFDERTGARSQTALTEAFANSLKHGIVAFASEFAGVVESELERALASNGLELDAGIADLLAERQSLYSFEYTKHWREQDAAYFGKLFHVDPSLISFAPNEEDFGHAKPPARLSDILAHKDPIAALNATQHRGFVTVVGRADNQIFLEDLGWIDWTVFPSNGPAIKQTETDGHGLLAEVQVGNYEEFASYMANIKANAHEHQHAGPVNGGYFFLNEQRLNLLLSSTLVNLRAGKR